ncbi:n-acetylglutamate synthase [Mangrovivirga cuniculi]|uniref:N-acetylglutamate synthase n=1 Tax=Mangrovivirga cuniculi TaxID=2715131 RepID=A0A4D7K4M3_9BACT|nr:n-acetylglutamate synthase [Mangrovivirga cuniculi]QCK15784.1 n-acetylglutamate synthase [Mangrovivirga cuniculi]
MINYDNKRFSPVNNTDNSETSEETIFHYFQQGTIVTAYYRGGNIKKGHLIGIVDSKGNIDMRYHQVNTNGQLMTGECKSTPEILNNGKIRLHEKWTWTSGDQSSGESVIEEI